MERLTATTFGGCGYLAAQNLSLRRLRLNLPTRVRIILRSPALGGFLAVFVGHGVGRFAYPALVPALVEHHWISSSYVGYLGAANLVGYLLGSLCGVRGKPTATHIGPSMLAVAISYLACSFPLGFWWLFAWRFVAGVGGGLVMTAAIPILQARTETAKRAGVVAFTFAGIGVGIVLTGAAMPRLLSHSIGFASAAMAMLSLVLTMVSWQAWQMAGPVAIKTEGMPITVRWTAQRVPISLLAISYATAAIAFVPYTIFWVDYIARGLHAGIRQAVMCWMLFGISAAFGPLLCAPITTRMGTARALRWALLANGAAVALPLVSTNLGLLAISSIGAGSMGLGIPFLTATRAREIAPPELHQRLWAGMTIVYAIAYAVAGWVFSSIFAVKQSYQFLFLWSGIAVLLGGITQYFGLPRVRHPSQEEVSSRAA